MGEIRRAMKQGLKEQELSSREARNFIVLSEESKSVVGGSQENLLYLKPEQKRTASR